MNQDLPGRSSPVLMRRWLGNELERLRKQAGLTQRRAAHELGWGLSKVGYVESGERPVSVADLEERMLPTYGVPEKERPRLVDMAVAANAKAWWDAYHDADMPPPSKRFTAIEQGASHVRTFQWGVFPGLLQTPAYAAAAIRATAAAPRAHERIDAIAEVRLRRQQVLLDPLDPLDIWAVLDETALLRPAGDAGVMRDQLLHVADLAERCANVTVQVIELRAGVHPAAEGSFSILAFPWPGDPGTVFLECGPTEARYLSTRNEVYLHSQVFGRLTEVALGPGASIDMLRTTAGEYNARAQ